jgi:hypothetical protein
MGFHKTLLAFCRLCRRFGRFHRQFGQARGDLFLVELSFAAAVGISPSQPGGEAMEKHLRAVIDHHLSKARSATTMEEMKAEYEEAITGILNAYKAVLAIVNVGLKNDIFIKAEEGTKH